MNGKLRAGVYVVAVLAGSTLLFLVAHEDRQADYREGGYESRRHILAIEGDVDTLRVQMRGQTAQTEKLRVDVDTLKHRVDRLEELKREAWEKRAPGRGTDTGRRSPQ